MEKFLLLFRQAARNAGNVSPLELQALIRQWQQWRGRLAATGNLTDTGARLDTEGKVLQAGQAASDSPFTETGARVGGFMIIQAHSLEEAATLAQSCPALDAGGSIEIRQLMS